MRISDWSSDVCSSDLVHAHTAPGNIGYPLGRGKPRRENQLPYLFVGRGLADRHALCQGLLQNLVAAQAAAIVADLDDDIAAIVFGRQNQLTYRVLARGNALFRRDRKSTRLNSSH